MVLGQRALPSLHDVEGPLGIVDVFRRIEEIPRRRRGGARGRLRGGVAAARAGLARGRGDVPRGRRAVRPGPLHQDGALPLVRRAELGRPVDRRDLVAARGDAACRLTAPFGFDTRQIHAGQRVDADHRRPRGADLPDRVVRLRGHAARRRPVRPEPLRQHVHAHRQPDHGGRSRSASRRSRAASARSRPPPGLGATAIALLTLAGQGDEIVSSANLYGGTHNQLAIQFPRFGITTRFVDPHDLDAVRAAITERTTLLYAETIGNPRIDVLDIAAWAADRGRRRAAAGDRQHLRDAVPVPPVRARRAHRRPLGDEVHRRPRHLDRRRDRRLRRVRLGRGRFPGVTEPSAGYRGMRFLETFGNFAFIMKARVETMRDLGPVLSPFNAFLFLQGLETLSLRMDRHCANARAIAAHLRAHPRVVVGLVPRPARLAVRRQRRALPAARPGRDPGVRHRRATARPAAASSRPASCSRTSRTSATRRRS